MQNNDVPVVQRQLIAVGGRLHLSDVEALFYGVGQFLELVHLGVHRRHSGLKVLHPAVKVGVLFVQVVNVVLKVFST